MKSKLHRRVVVFCLVVAVAVTGMLSFAGISMSQVDVSVNDIGDDSIVVENVEDSAENTENITVKKTDQEKYGFSIDRMPSLFFTYWQQQSIIDAKNSRGSVRAPTPAELAALENGEEALKPKPEERYITLGGIVYNGKNDWTIWLNDERVQPDAVPEEVISLKVFKDYIEIKWLDKYTNQVFPLRLRSHQRFNMDMRIFLPG